MMCRLIQRLLPLYAGDDLPRGLGKWVATHTRHCERCAAELGGLKSARDQIRVLAKLEAPLLPMDFAVQARKHIEQGDEQSPVFPKWHHWVWGAAAMLLIAGFGWFSAFDQAPVLVEKTKPVTESALVMQEPVEEFSAGDLASMMSLLNPNRELTDAELDRKYPVVESVKFPNGTQMVYHTDDPNTKIVWVVAQEGAQVQ